MKLAVVFVSYLKVPEQRLRDHFTWNDEIYRAYGDRLRVYVVTDVDREVPDYATCVLYPMDRLPLVRGRRRFSLTRTKNTGITQAILDGADVVICTDVDIAFSLDVFQRMADVEESEAVVPLYCMASDADGEDGHIDQGCTGTIAMTAANWNRLPYEERCVGYGADDGILVNDIKRAGLEIIRDGPVIHVAHIEGDGNRTPGSGSASCWGRDDGFNYDNFRQNRRLHRRRK